MPYDPLTAAAPGTGLDYVPSYWTATARAAPLDDGPLHGATDVAVAIIGGAKSVFRALITSRMTMVSVRSCSKRIVRAGAAAEETAGSREQQSARSFAKMLEHDCVRGTTLPVLSHIIVTRPMTADEKAASGFVTEHVLTDTRDLLQRALYQWYRYSDNRS